MIVQIAGTALLIYVVILGVAATAQYRQSKQEVERASTRLAESYASRLDGYLREASRIAETTAKTLDSGVSFSDDEIYQLLESNVRQMELVYGSCLAFEPGTRRPAEELFAPYVFRGPAEENLALAQRGPPPLRRMNIDKSVYDWYRDPAYTWYSQPKKIGQGVWSAPYFDEGAGNILMSTYSAAFRAKDSFGGVCTVDIDLPRLRETVGREIDEKLDFVILAADGRYVFHPDASRIMKDKVGDYEDGSGGKLASLVTRMLAGASGAAWLNGWETTEPVGVFYAPIPSTGWVFVSRVPVETVLSDVRRRTFEQAAALVAALLLIAGSIWFVAGRISSPIVALDAKVAEISRGNLEARVDETSRTTEIQHLAKGFNRMTADLRANVERLAVEKAERQKIERDLDIAREIQQSLLPTSTPDLADYDIAGWSRTADQTGGDYYDWQVLPDGRVLVTLADVSGHGIGPALVAAVCRAYARASVDGEQQDLARFMQRINDLLMGDLPEDRFVTFAGVLLDPSRHSAHMLSAGHGPLYRCRASHGDLMELHADDLPFGLALDNPSGPAAEFRLDPGDFILLVTDGLFEWSNASGEGFGLERLRETIRATAKASSDEIIRALVDGVEKFAAPSPQMDDITIVVIRRR